jgi:hypothetical protein
MARSNKNGMKSAFHPPAAAIIIVVALPTAAPLLIQAQTRGGNQLIFLRKKAKLMLGRENSRA